MVGRRGMFFYKKVFAYIVVSGKISTADFPSGYELRAALCLLTYQEISG